MKILINVLLAVLGLVLLWYIVKYVLIGTLAVIFVLIIEAPKKLSQLLNALFRFGFKKMRLPRKSALNELAKLVGMENIKKEVFSLIDFLKVQKQREKAGLKTQPVSLHAVFCGPPGTGKTTIARILGKIYQEIGLLPSGHLIETDRSGLVGQYLGETAIKTNKMIDSALGGILFIDEAYALKPEHNSRDFGPEAIDTLVKRMEDDRSRFAVIVAGYPSEMERFINSNPGLKSRFNRYFYFEDSKPNELFQIFLRLAKQNQYTIAKDAQQKALELFTELYDHRDQRFGNGRLVRNIFEK